VEREQLAQRHLQRHLIIGRDVPLIMSEKGAQSVFDLPGHLIANDRLIFL
jgi:hypothetical protein